MKHHVCQSCGFILMEENRGTNRDHSVNDEYCIHCYQSGEFTDQSLNVHSLEIKLNDMARTHNEITREEAEHIIHILPTLKRWKMDFM